MDEQYLLASACYVELNPVRAKLVKRAQKYPWSRAAAHLNGENDILVNVEPMSAMVVGIYRMKKLSCQSLAQTENTVPSVQDFVSDTMTESL